MHGRRRQQFGFGEQALVCRVPEGHFLVRVDKLIDWSLVERLLESLYSHTGRPSHPPLVLLKILLLQQWFGLSDPQAEAQVKDRLSFMRFVGLGLDDDVPDETTLVRFRHNVWPSCIQAFWIRSTTSLMDRGACDQAWHAD